MHHPEAFTLGNGVFKCKDDDMACVLQDKIVVTIKDISEEHPDYAEIRKRIPDIDDLKPMSTKRHSRFKNGKL